MIIFFSVLFPVNLSLRSSPLKERLDTVGCKYQFTIILHREIVLTLVLLLANHSQ